jgi:hypothetical protein
LIFYLSLRLVRDSDQGGGLHRSKQCQRGIPLDTCPGGVLGLQRADPFDLEHLGTGESAEGAFAELQSVDGRAAGAGIGRFHAAHQGVGIEYPIRDGNGDAVIELHELAQGSLAYLDVAVGCPGQQLELAAAAAAHQQHIGLAAFDGIDELVNHGEGKGSAGSPGSDQLIGGGAGIDELDNAVKLLGIGGRVPVEELLFELMADRLGLLLDDGCLQVLDITAGGLEEVIDIGIAAHDLEGGGGLGEGRGRLHPGIADIVEIDRGQRGLTSIAL